MQIRWFGQSAFVLRGRSSTVMIDPFDELPNAAARGLRFDYKPVEPTEVSLLVITHEHRDHNAAHAALGSPDTVRSTAGTFDTSVGKVVAICSEHDDVAGTNRGPNAIVCFSLDGLTVCHFGDFGQSRLRPAQREAIGEPDVLCIPVGGGPTIDGLLAAEIVYELRPRLVVPMHYRTDALNFLDPPEVFLEALGDAAVTAHIEESQFHLDELVGTQTRPTVALPAWG